MKTPLLQPLPQKTRSAHLMRKQKLKECAPVNVAAVKTSLEKEIREVEEEEEEVGGPHMTKQVFETCYPHVNLGLKLYTHLTIFRAMRKTW